VHKLFPEEPKFEIGKVGFDDKDANGQKLDLLNRRPLGQKLTDLVDRINQPLVIALDGGWGSGKSHFLKLWAGAHKKELGGKAEAIYFDAFEHDYLDDPLVSLVSRLTTENATETWGATAVLRVKKAALPVAKLLLRAGLAAAVAAATGAIVPPSGDAATEKAGDIADENVEAFWKAESSRIAAMQGFRDALKTLTGEGENARKIVFIIDELDRCRPDYALNLLEIIKHFFTVPNVHFVLGVNLKELENSVKARYGAEISAAKYLQKFVSLTMTLPSGRPEAPESSAAHDYLNAVIKDYVHDPELLEAISKRLERLAKQQDLSLRDMQRILAQLSLLPTALTKKYWGYQIMVVGTLFLKVLHPATYAKVRRNLCSQEEVAASLSLAKPQDESHYELHYRDWAIWAFVLGSKAALEIPGMPVDVREFTTKSFGPYGFNERFFDTLCRDAFDSFTLPPLPTS
jgi:hypothetical protein